MVVKNNAIMIRRELFTRLCKLLEKDQLVEEIDRIPLEMRPRNNGHIRCCVHKDRAVLKYKLMACLGFNIEDESDELAPISSYAEEALNRREISDVKLTVVDEACSSCRKANYVVTNMCNSCVGRPCQINCPKNAIDFVNGRAHIQDENCVNCGICMGNCPFHAIIYSPVPCESACPVDAISKDELGIARIDHTKCILCGRCYEACPYGAVMEKSQLVEIYNHLRSDKKVIALTAPSLYGQFKASPSQINDSIKALGFDDVIEVAEGAVDTIKHETEEFENKILKEEAQKMTTSCCPSYIELVKKHIPEMEKFISSARTPLFYTKELVLNKYPGATLVFVSPCMAKRHEAFQDSAADYTLNFEEFGAMLAAKGIELSDFSPKDEESSESTKARKFAWNQGISELIEEYLEDSSKLRALQVSGIDKASVKNLKKIAKGRSTENFIEVMSCCDGCISGCNTIARPGAAKRQIEKFK